MGAAQIAAPASVCANVGAEHFEHPMPLRKLIDRASYAPEALAVIFEAFDQAWAEVAKRFDTDDPAALELARNRLALAVLAVAKPSAADVAELKSAAIAAFDEMSPYSRS